MPQTPQDKTNGLNDTDQPHDQHDSRYDIAVEVDTQYMPSHSKPDGNHHVFAYHIRITNQGSQAAQLLTRH